MRNHRNRLFAVIVAAVLPLGSVAAYEIGPQPPAPAFEQIDVNHDGVLSRSELPDGLQDLRMHFEQYAFVDHYITRATYEAYADPGRRLREIHFSKPRGQYALSHP